MSSIANNPMVMLTLILLIVAIDAPYKDSLTQAFREFPCCQMPGMFLGLEGTKGVPRNGGRESQLV